MRFQFSERARDACRRPVLTRSLSSPSRITSRPNSNSSWSSHQPRVDSGSSCTMSAIIPARYLAGMMADIVHDDPESTLGWCDDQEEFEFGLDVILDGLDRLRVRTGRRQASRARSEN